MQARSLFATCPVLTQTCTSDRGIIAHASCIASAQTQTLDGRIIGRRPGGQVAFTQASISEHVQFIRLCLHAPAFQRAVRSLLNVALGQNTLGYAPAQRHEADGLRERA